MKKLFLLFALIPLLISCDNDQDTSWNVVNVSVSQANWIPHVDGEGLNLYYSCTLAMPEITSFIYEQGLVQVYYLVSGAQEVLPYVRHYENLAGARWTQTVDYDYSVGSMTVYVTSSDFFEELPSAMDFRVVLMW
jgi:hypothetical protein